MGRVQCPHLCTPQCDHKLAGIALIDWVCRVLCWNLAISRSSLVIRDLTLRSASSFGSFHLMRLLFDEYVVYYLERKVTQRPALATTEAVAAAKAKVCPYGCMSRIIICLLQCWNIMLRKA